MLQSLLNMPPLEGFLLFHGAIAIFFLIAAYTHRWLGIVMLPLAAGYWWMVRREFVLAAWFGTADQPGANGADPRWALASAALPIVGLVVGLSIGAIGEARRPKPPELPADIEDIPLI
jgi:hypothetical protein